MQIETKNLTLLPHAPAHLRALITGADAYERSFGHRAGPGLRDFIVSKEVSPEYLAKLGDSTAPDHWAHGFAVVHRVDRSVIGMAGFKSPPGTDGVVEIAYGIVPDYQGKGYATEAARALVAFAFNDSRVRLVIAHTLPEHNASTTVLTKCGFERTGEIVDPHDGLVWRWEKLPERSDGAMIGG